MGNLRLVLRNEEQYNKSSRRWDTVVGESYPNSSVIRMAGWLLFNVFLLYILIYRV